MLFVSINDIRKYEERSDLGQIHATTESDLEAEKISSKKTHIIHPDLKLKDKKTSNSELLNRKAMLEKVHTEPLDFAFDRAIGTNDSVYSNFCELIGMAKKSVGRIVIKEGSKNIGFATGFMVSETLMLTNWHVFKTFESVADSEIEFNYELDIFGRSLTEICFKLDPETFYFSNESLDYCFVAVSPYDVSKKVPLSNMGYHYLDPEVGKVGEDEKEFLNIIHHPSGDFKQLSIRENRFTKRTDKTLWYESDTAQGSSGGPVFNDQWQVVALHHMGKAKRSDDDKHYVDKNGNIIPLVGGKIDISKIFWIANEGIRVSVIMDDILTRFPDSEIIRGLKNKPVNKPELVSGTGINQPTSNIENMSNNNDQVNISIPSGLVENGKTITVTINSATSASLGKLGNGNHTNSHDIESDLFAEIKKTEKEDNIDFSECKGYDQDFLGKKNRIALPMPTKTLLRDIARLNGSKEIELKYFKYSVIFNSVTRMSAISAINVEGDGKQRPDNSTRNDDWLRDHRIERDIQLRDKWYASSNFDKGHMSRWEDANWDEGKNKEIANRNGVFTCFYTNACPQVKDLNRAGGLWGKLENAILRDGVLKEQGKQARVTVFNGPIHRKKDKPFRGVKVPLEFYKIILWLNDDNKLNATGFILSQKDLVRDIDWADKEELEPEEIDLLESIDIDQVEKFKEYQCKIEVLSKLTQLNFKHLYKYDTFGSVANDDEEVLRIDSEEQLTEMINLNLSSAKKK